MGRSAVSATRVQQVCSKMSLQWRQPLCTRYTLTCREFLSQNLITQRSRFWYIRIRTVRTYEDQMSYVRALFMKAKTKLYSVSGVSSTLLVLAFSTLLMPSDVSTTPLIDSSDSCVDHWSLNVL